MKPAPRLTLIGLTLAIGIFIDDAIVVIENIMKKMEEGQNPFQASFEGIKEVAFSILAISSVLLLGTADLVGKVEVGIPEDDPRNPAVVADNVGDNVGDVAGMGADIFDGYVASAVAVMLLGASMGLNQAEHIKYTVVPLILCMLGIFASLIGVSLVRVKEGQKPGPALNRGTVITCIIFAIFLFVLFVSQMLIPESSGQH